MQLPDDSRAQAHGYFVGAAIVVIGALLFTMMEPAASAIFDLSLSQTSNPEATEVINERQQIFGYILIYIMFLFGIFMIARSVLQSRTPG